MELLDLFQMSWPVNKAGYEIEDGTIVPADKERERRALDELDDLLESYIESHAPNDSEIIVFMNNALERLRIRTATTPSIIHHCLWNSRASKSISENQSGMKHC